MGTLRQPKGDLRGMIVPLAHTLGATMTATSEAGPRPGGMVPSDTNTGSMPLATTGTLDPNGRVGTGEQVTLVALRAGGVGAAAVRWRYTTDTAQRSWDPPLALSGWDFIDRSSVANRWTRPHVVRDPSSGLVYVVAVKDLTDVVVWRQDQFGTWADATVATTGDNTCATLVVLPSGRLVCLYVASVSASQSQIQMAVSDDGATWTVGTSACLATPLGYPGTNYKRIRAAYANGRILVLLQETDSSDVIRQYVSADGGCTLQAVETFSSSAKAYPDIAAYDGTFYVACLQYDASGLPTSTQPYVRKLVNASQPLSSCEAFHAGPSTGTSTWGTYSAGAFTSGDCAVVVDDDGTVYLYGRDHATGGGATYETMVRVSRDGGETWGANGPDMHHAVGSVIHRSGDASSYIHDFSVALERGRVALVHRMAASPAGHDDSLCAAYLGGWSTVGMPESAAYDVGLGHGAWHGTYLPIDLPENTGSIYTQTVTGSAASSLTAYGLKMEAGAGESNNYTATPTVTSPGSNADGALAEFHVQIGEGTWVHSVRISDGSNDFEATVTLSETTITLLDANGGTIATASVDGTDGVVIRIAVDKPSGAWTSNVGRVRAWYRVDGPYTGAVVVYGARADREWTSLGTSSALVSGTETTPRIFWGITGATASDSAIYRCVFWSAAPYHGATVSGSGIASSVNGAARGRVVPSQRSPIHIAEGLRVHGLGGVALTGDTWTHDTAYAYPVENVDPSRAPSPRMEWRSKADGVEADIVWSSLDMGWRSGDPVAVYIDGANWATATLYRDSTGTNKVMDLDMTVPDLDFTRSRDTLIPAPGGTSPDFFFHENQLTGCYVDLGGGVIRKIRSNTAGSWLASGAPGTYPSARIILENYDGADPSSGTMAVRMKSGFFFVESLQATGTLMLRIPAQDTAEGAYRLGVCLIGRLRLMQQWSRGRGMLFSPLYDLTTLPSGAKIGRGRGAHGGAVEVTWDDGIVTTGLHTSGSAPSWYTLGYTGADAIAAPAATSRTLAGILRETEGPTVPIVLCHAIKQLSAATTPTAPYRDLNPEAVLYGRAVMETLRVDTRPDAGGAELRDPGEVVRIATLVVEREV